VKNLFRVWKKKLKQSPDTTDRITALEDRVLSLQASFEELKNAVGGLSAAIKGKQTP
jgi:hypothetical protein